MTLVPVVKHFGSSRFCSVALWKQSFL